MSMPKGMQIMVEALIKMIGLKPEVVMSSVEDIRKNVHSAAADMATIRRQNIAIMAHLGIAEPTQENTDGQHEQRTINGSGGLAS